MSMGRLDCGVHTDDRRNLDADLHFYTSSLVIKGAYIKSTVFCKLKKYDPLRVLVNVIIKKFRQYFLGGKGQ